MIPGTAADRAAALSRRLDEQLARARQDAADPAPPEPAVHGPRVTLPHDSGMAGADATDTQRTHAAGLARRLAERTRTSKELAQYRRSVLADSRAVVGFRRSTKETLYPLAARDARGAHLTDVDGNTYTDITMGFGSLLLGHEPSCVTEAVRAHLDGGLRFGPRPVEAGEVAELLAEFTGMERVAFAASGTEANSAAIRLARAATGRDRIVMFRGSYHGHIDTVLGRPGPGDSAVPVSRGIPDSAVAELIVLEYGSQEALTTIDALGDRIAAVLVEPVQCRNPALRPVAFLRELRELTRRRGIVLLFDEMLTGLRPHPRGAQHHFGVVPDLATYGKALGSGFPVGAIAGRADIMDGVDGGFWRYGDESRPTAETTFFGGTYLQHPLSMAAAKAVLTHLAAEGPGLQERLNARTDALADDLNRFFTDEEFPLELAHFGSMFRFVHRADMELLYQHLLLRGIYVWEWRSFYLSTAHSDTDTERVADAVKGSLRELRDAGFFPASRPTSGRVRPDPRPKRPDFGVYFFGDYPDADSTSAYERLVDTARFADERGFSSLWLPERHFHSFGGLFPNPAVLAASLARETSRIRLNAGSVVLPLHDPVRVAEEWSVVDNLSGGRVGLGCATGWHAQDFALHPDRFERRKEIAFAHLDDVTTLWRGGAVRRVTGEGEPVDVTIHPRPVQELPPMFLATSGRRASYEEAGRRGLGIVTNLMGQTVAELADNIRHFRKAREQHGLDPDTGRVAVLLHTYLGTDHATARAEALEPMSRYLRSSLQMRSAASAVGAGPEDVATASEDDLDYLFRRAYDRYCDERALIGTPDSCAPLVQTLHEAGVDEIAALVDFGMPAERMRAGLEHLDTLRRRTLGALPVEVGAEGSVLPGAGAAGAVPPGAGTDKAGPPGAGTAEAVPPGAGTVEALLPGGSTDKAVPSDAGAVESVLPGTGAVEAVLPGRSTDKAVPSGAVDVVGSDSAGAYRRGSAEGLGGLATGGPPAMVRRGPATDAQRRLWLAARLIADPAAYNEIQSVRLRGPLSERALRAAVAGLVERHAGLRTVFRAAGDTVEQVVRPDLRPELTVTDVHGAEAVTAVLREESGRPYDLAEGPLFTPRLLRLAADDHVLVLGLHHIITDAHSAGLLAADLEELYRASVEDRDPVFATPAGSTLDELRAAHAPAHLHEPASASPTGTTPPGHRPTSPDTPSTGYDPVDLEWWREYLDPLPPSPALPTDRPRGRRVAGRGAAEEVFWGAGRTGRLREWSGRHGVTLFSTLLTAWQLVLRERSGQDEFVVGSTFGRRRPGTEHTVGFHVAVLPLKASLTDTTVLRDAVRTTRDALFAADAHQHVDVDALLAAVNPDPGHPRPLVTVSADLDGAPLSRLRLPGLTAEQIPGGTESAPLELALAVLDTRDGLRLRIRYDADLHDASTVRGLLADLDRVLEAMAGGRAVTVADTQPAAAPEVSDSETPAPRETETLRTLWSSVLGTDDVSDTADFFDLGGSSIAAIRLHNRVRDALGVEFSLADFFAEPTLGALIRSLTGSGPAGVAGVAGVAEDIIDRAPVTDQQARMLAAQPALPRPQVYNVPTRIRLTGPVDTDALRTALTGLVRRHQSLRTRYVRDGEGAWWQEVVDVAPPPLRIVDYSRLPAERAAQRAEQACRAAADEPFDLTRPTLPRLRLLRVAPDEWVLMFVVHHICTDGWSHGVLLGELAALYTAAATGTAPTLSAPSAQPADHARRQLARRGGTERARRAAHFVDHLTGVPTRLEVPTDRPRSGHLSGDGDTVRAHAPAELRGRVERFAAAHRVTPFAVAAAALGITVARLSGRRDLLVGVPYANRDGSDTETLVSLVSTNMPVRIRVGPEETCAGLVARTGAETLAAMANVLPTAEVWQALREAGVREVPEVVSCLLVFQNTDDVEIEIPGLGVEVDDVAPPAARTELTFGLTPRRDPSLGYRAYVEYSADLWDRKSAERILASYLSALDDLCAEPGRTVGELLAPTTSGEA
ncbi:MupA/Atu3671 family FMN-dependent luciferase-like monooxygenase [Streptomyces sp. NPDC021056]|uniref:MupA/Atu3671 family FMN-dependent luciferase-like monooxygenase n=1 Tax=Streptomyces sp. NPDC021056 TaxID=3155012 RepID=UPI00340D133F